MITKDAKVGDLVDIYEDPSTEQKLEGKARLIKKLNDESINKEYKIESWTVMFEKGEADFFERQIKVKLNP